jgi:hypothetical protein
MDHFNFLMITTLARGVDRSDFFFLNFTCRKAGLIQTDPRTSVDYNTASKRSCPRAIDLKWYIIVAVDRNRPTFHHSRGKNSIFRIINI